MNHFSGIFCSVTSAFALSTATVNGVAVEHPSDFDYITYDHPQFKAAGVLPYSQVNGETFVLLGKQSSKGTCEGLWKGFGGKKDPGETPFQNALREFAEESKTAIISDPSPYIEDSHPLNGVMATAHLNCRYYQLMIPVQHDELLPERFHETLAATDFEDEKSELAWVKLDDVVNAVHRARVLCLLHNCPPSQLKEAITLTHDEQEVTLSPDFVETLMIQLLNGNDGIHQLLEGAEVQTPTFSTDEAPNFYENESFSLNTGNPSKLEEFRAYFEARGWDLTMTTTDLEEIDAAPSLVAIHKASQMEDRVLVEDTSLDVEGAEIGTDIKYSIDTLDDHVGSRATWRVLLGFKDNGHVYTFKGEVKGTIVEARGSDGFGFDPYFLPDGADKTLAESKPEQFSARAAAINALLEANIDEHAPEMTVWSGPWQDNRV